MQALLPEYPLKNPKTGLFDRDLDQWVLDEAIAAFTGTASSLQAALDIYQRSVFLAVSVLMMLLASFGKKVGSRYLLAHA